jgi:CHAD domain-containing protein
MSETTPISPIAADRRVGLEASMQRVADRIERVRARWDADSVHDLRVALRRCRTMAEALSQVSPGSGWRKVRKSSRDQFHALGELRDTQVEREWLRKLAPARVAVRVKLLGLLAKREREQQEAARKTLDDFSLKEWKKLSRKLERKTQLFPLESIVFQRLGMAKLNEAASLFSRARKGRSRVLWHQARIGLKQFRYLMENFLPQRYAGWSADVKRIQDLLGETHDLDVLRLDIRRNAKGIDQQAVAALLERIKLERRVRLAEVIAKTSGNGSLLLSWRAGLEIAHTISSPPLLNRRTA